MGNQFYLELDNNCLHKFGFRRDHVYLYKKIFQCKWSEFVNVTHSILLHFGLQTSNWVILLGPENGIVHHNFLCNIYKFNLEGTSSFKSDVGHTFVSVYPDNFGTSWSWSIDQNGPDWSSVFMFMEHRQWK